MYFTYSQWYMFILYVYARSLHDWRLVTCMQVGVIKDLFDSFMFYINYTVDIETDIGGMTIRSLCIHAGT